MLFVLHAQLKINWKTVEEQQHTIKGHSYHILRGTVEEGFSDMRLQQGCQDKYDELCLTAAGEHTHSASVVNT